MKIAIVRLEDCVRQKMELADGFADDEGEGPHKPTKPWKKVNNGQNHKSAEKKKSGGSLK
jgi:hypothetical protein